MVWLNPRNITASGYDPEVKISEFLLTAGELGRIAFEAWATVGPLHVPSDEYLGYVERFVKETGRYIPSEWQTHPGLVVELVRRSFHPAQVCHHVGLGEPFVNANEIKTIAEMISRGVAELGGWEELQR